MNHELTARQRWLSRKYLTYHLLTNFWFVSAVWLYFYRLFVTDQQVGILDAGAFALGLIAEIPSGALADRFGRSKLVKIGQFLVGTSFIVQGLGSRYAQFLVGQSMLTIGLALISGADDALFYDQLQFAKESSHWKKLVARGTQLSLLVTLFATVAGGWMYGVNPRLPWLACGAAFIISVFSIWSVKDARVLSAAKSFSHEVREHLKSIKEGIQQFRMPQLRLYIPIILIVQGLFYASGWGLLRVVLLSQFHFGPFESSIVLAITNIITVAVLSYLRKNSENLSERHVISAISLAAVLGLLLSLANIGWWGFFVILALYAGENLLHPFMSEVLNKHAVEDKRATVLSVASFMQAAPYVVLGPVIGYLSTHGSLRYFLVVWAGMTFAALLVYLVLRKRDDTVSLRGEELATEKKIPEIE